MPRHRKERVPRHGAQRRIENPGRRVGSSGAVAGPNPALETSEPVIDPSGPALGMSWSDFVATAEADLSPTVPIMLGKLGMLPSVNPTDAVPTATHNAALDGADLDGAALDGADLDGAVVDSPVVDGTVVDGTVVDGTVVDATVLGGTSAGGTSAGGAALYDAEPGLPAFRPAPEPRRRGGLVGRAVRGLLMTPWFAASTGFVIATGIWVHSPHASITFPPGTIHCPRHGCMTQGGKGSGSPATSAPGQRLRTTHEGRGSEQSAGASMETAGLTFTFTVLSRGDDSFGAAISISGRRSLGAWQLAFRLPGTQVQNVFGAEWQQLASGDGGTASPFHVAFGRAADYDGVSFRIFGTGSLSRPTSCTFDGATCTFKVASARKHAAFRSGSGDYGGGLLPGGY